MIRVLLSLDLTNKESERDNFNNFLAEQQWKKLAGVNTVWAIEYDDFSQTNEQHVTKSKETCPKCCSPRHGNSNRTVLPTLHR